MITTGYFFGKKIAYNVEMDALRIKECLCRNCANFKPGEDDNCSIAQSLYSKCVDFDMAMMITRCGSFCLEAV